MLLRWTGVAACLAAVAVSLPACGGDKRRAPKRTGIADPRPREGIDEVLARVEGAATASSCTPVKGLLHGTYGELSDAACQSVKVELGGFRDPVGRAYRTGAVIEYEATPGHLKRMALALDTDRLFKVAFIEDATSRSLGTPRPAAFDAAAARVIATMRGGDCDTFLRHVDRRIGLGTGSDQQVCQRVSGDPFRRELVANRGARTVPLGGTSQIAFYKVRTARVRYWTMIMVGGEPAERRAAARYLLVNAFAA
jgi:hypothetical protein